MGKQWKHCQTLFWGGSKIIADGDCSHETKRRLLLGRKVMTNLDSIFKNRDITFINSLIHNWMLFFLWLHLFILSGVIFPLISSSMLGTYRPGEFTFQCPIFSPFHTVHGVFKARILKWFAIPFSSGPRFVRSLHHEPTVVGGPTWHGS